MIKSRSLAASTPAVGPARPAETPERLSAFMQATTLLGVLIPTALGGLLTLSWKGALLGLLWEG